MTRTALALILATALAPGLAAAQSTQMLRTIDMRLPFYQIDVDVNTLTRAQATAIYFELTSEPVRGAGDRLKKRNRILHIIRKGEDF